MGKRSVNDKLKVTPLPVAAGDVQSEILGLLQHHPVLKVLPTPTLQDLAQPGAVIVRPAERHLLREGDSADHLFFLLAGIVRIYHRSDDRQVLLKLLFPPALFGEVEVLAGVPFQENAQTLNACRLLRIEAAAFQKLLREHPLFTQYVARDMAERFCISINTEKNLAFNVLQPRLARMLLDYAQAFGVTDSAGGPCSIKITQVEIARNLAVTRQYVHSGLQHLVDKNLIRRGEGNRYLLLDVEGLTRLALGTSSLLYRSK